MALSNIRKEPRREITESLVGITGLAGVIWLDYLGSNWINTGLSPKDQCPIVVVMVAIPVVLFILFLIGMAIVYCTHALGEKICGALAHRGLDPRPRRGR